MKTDCSHSDLINKYLINDLQRRLGTDDLLAWIDSQAVELANKGRSAVGHIHFSEPLLQNRRIKRILGAQIVGKACIKPSGEYYEISYNSRLSIPTLRFAIAHEIGHTYWFQPGGGAKALSPLQRKLGRDPDIEYLCNRFADALLFPVDIVRISQKYFHGINSFPLEIVPNLAAQLKVDEKTVIRRLFFQTSDLAAVICLRRLANRGWRVQWTALSNGAYERQPSGFKVPLLDKRMIPPGMVPSIPVGITEQLELDARWWEGLKQVPLTKARIPLSRINPGAGRKGFAYRTNDRVYLALPTAAARS